MTDRVHESPLDLRREERLLAVVAAYSSSTEGYPESLTASIESLVACDFDWDFFLKLAGYQHSLPLAHRLLRDLGLIDLMSEKGRNLAEHEYMLSEARFIKKEAELLDILEAFKERGIVAISIKGVPLAYLLYRDPGVRTLKDIDILVRSSDINAAGEVMREKGYELYTALRSAADYEEHHFHYVYSRGAKLDSIVEIHWSLVYPDAGHRVADSDAIFDRARAVTVQRASVGTLSLPHAFWHLAIHASYKSFMSLRNLAELRRIAVKLGEKDWEYVVAWSRMCATDAQMRGAIELAESLFGRFIERSVACRLPSGIVSCAFLPAMFYPRALVWEWVPFGDTHVLAIELLVQKGLAGKLRCLYHFVFPNRQMALKYYFLHWERTRFSRIRSALNGLYVMCKVLALVSFFPMIVRGRLLGGDFLDPARHVNNREGS